MNVSEFTAVLKQPEKVSEDHLSALKKVIEEYPWFQPARALYLKTLKHRGSFEYNTALKHTAAYTTDRAVLFRYITSESFSQHKTAEAIRKEHSGIHTITVNPGEIVIEPVNREETKAVLDPELFHPKTTEAEPATESDKKAPEEQLRLGEPLDFNPGELHSFAEWLKLSVPLTVNRDPDVRAASEAKEKRNKRFERIDKFIAENPRIIPGKNTEVPRDLTGEATVEKSELMTETLARVYLEQKKFKKAIRAYKILSLKYPEKSGFFADQIKAIKKLQQK